MVDHSRTSSVKPFSTAEQFAPYSFILGSAADECLSAEEKAEQLEMTTV